MTNILGIDPGTHRLGWAIVSGTTQHPSLVKSGCLEFPTQTPASIYLPKIYTHIQSLINDFSPTLATIEGLFAQHNLKTVVSVGESRGVVRLALVQAKISVTEYSPNTIKATVTGNGSAGKNEVTRMVGLLLGVNTQQLLDDETDAIAVALTTQILCKHT